ncbi:MAG: wax ester/triacylglycerol synthase family O-acyltransferase [Myxococcota bacterium]
MASYSYDRLSAQDNSFLLWETPYLHMHVASTLILETGPFRTHEGGVDVERYKRATEAILHRVPRYRQKLHWIPGFQHAVWVDDPRFSLGFHIRHTALPKPGTPAQLKRLSARIMSQPLDRRRPLWENWVVEGLEGGERFALITKIHHCMIDGSSGMDLSQILMSISPEVDELEPPPPFIPKPAPSRAELLRAEVGRTLTTPLRVARDLRRFSEESEDARAEIGTRLRAIVKMAGMGMSADPTPLNGSAGPHRRFDWWGVPLAEMKAMRHALGCTINDVVLTVVTGAVREYLLLRGVDPTSLTFRVSSPVSVRSEEERGKLGNRVSSWVIELPIGEPDPQAQLAALHAETARLKEERTALGVETIMKVADFTPSTLLTLGARASSGPINTIVTNVPGPQFPLYLQGARLLAMYPQVPLLEGMGVGIGLLSYDGTVNWGFNSDPEIVPDADVFVEQIKAAYARVAKLAPEEPKPAGAGTRKRASRPARRGNGRSATAVR